MPDKDIPSGFEGDYSLIVYNVDGKYMATTTLDEPKPDCSKEEFIAEYRKWVDYARSVPILGDDVIDPHSIEFIAVVRGVSFDAAQKLERCIGVLLPMARITRQKLLQALGAENN